VLSCPVSGCLLCWLLQKPGREQHIYVAQQDCDFSSTLSTGSLSVCMHVCMYVCTHPLTHMLLTQYTRNHSIPYGITQALYPFPIQYYPLPNHSIPYGITTLSHTVLPLTQYTRNHSIPYGITQALYPFPIQYYPLPNHSIPYGITPYPIYTQFDQPLYPIQYYPLPNIHPPQKCPSHTTHHVMNS
jgi:hypothetical protein